METDGHMVVADGGGGAAPTPTPTDGWAAGAASGGSSGGGDGGSSSSAGSFAEGAGAAVSLIGVGKQISEITPEQLRRWGNVAEDLLEDESLLKRFARYGDPLEDAIRSGAGPRITDFARRFIRPLARIAAPVGAALDYQSSDARTGLGKGLSSLATVGAYAGAPQAALLDIPLEGAFRNSLDFVTNAGGSVRDPGLDNFETWSDANVGGDNGWLFGNYAALGDATAQDIAPYVSMYEVDEATGGMRFQWNITDWLYGT